MRAPAEDFEVAALIDGPAFEDAAVAEVQAEHFAVGAIRYGIEPDERHLIAGGKLEGVPDAAETALTPMQPADTDDRPDLRHFFASNRGDAKRTPGQ